MSLRLS